MSETPPGILAPKTLRRYSTNCHVIEFDPGWFELDVTLGDRVDQLQTLSTMKGEYSNQYQKMAGKMTAAQYDPTGQSADTLGTYVDHDKFYTLSAKKAPTLIFWKDQTLSIEFEPPQERLAYYQQYANFAIGGMYSLIIDGEVNYKYSHSELKEIYGDIPFTKLPRTLIGQKADGTIVMVATDTSTNYSAGLNLDQEAAIMEELNCVVAISMSHTYSQLYTDRTINLLQNGFEQRIGSAFLIYRNVEKQTPEVIEPPAPAPTPEPTPEPTTFYRVQVGAFSTRAYADNYLKQLEADGYQGFVVEAYK